MEKSPGRYLSFTMMSYARLGKEHQVLVIDLAREFPKSSRYYYDFYHYTNEGSALVAEIIYKHLYIYLKNKYSIMLNRQAVSGRE